MIKIMYPPKNRADFLEMRGKMVYRRNPEKCGAFIRECVLKHLILLSGFLAFALLFTELLLRMDGTRSHRAFAAIATAESAWVLIMAAVISFFIAHKSGKAYSSLEIELTDEYIERRACGFTVRIPLSEIKAVVPFRSFVDGASLKVCGADWTAIGIPADTEGFEYIREKLMQNAQSLTDDVIRFRRIRIAFSIVYFSAAAAAAVISLVFRKEWLIIASWILFSLYFIMRTVFAFKSKVRMSMKVMRLVSMLIVVFYLGLRILRFIRMYY